jgi:nicotinamide-nucleotide amidase
VVYATDLKASLAGVPSQLLKEYGPVHPEIAGALAVGALRRCAADWGLSTTGVAGPDPQDGQQPGTVYIGLAGSGGVTVESLALVGDRAAIRAAAVGAAIALLLANLET